MSKQTFDVSANLDMQNARQLTTLESTTSRRGGPDSGEVTDRVSYPLTIDYSFVVNPDGSFSQTTTADQKDLQRKSGWESRRGGFAVKESNEVHATDTLNWDASGVFLGRSGASTTETYRLKTSDGVCWDRTLVASNQVLNSVTDSSRCGGNDR